MLIWSDAYLRLKECCRKFWTIINSGVEDARVLNFIEDFKLVSVKLLI